MRLAGGSFARGGPRCWPWASGPCRNRPSEHRLPWIWKRCGSAPIEHIKAHGNLIGFPARRGERIALVTTAGKHGLVVWNRSRGRYELTNRGHRRVRALRRAGRNALRARQGGAVRSGINAVVTAAGTVVVVGATFLAFHPAGSTDSAPLRE